MTPAAGQPGAGGVCEEETGEFRGPLHGQKKAPALRSQDSTRESGIGMRESGPIFLAERIQ